MEENFSVICGTFDSYDRHLDIFKCLSINIYGDLTQNKKIQKQIRNYMIKVHQVARLSTQQASEILDFQNDGEDHELKKERE